MHQRLQESPILTIPDAAEQLKLSVPTVTKAIAHLEQLGFIAEVTGKQRHPRYVCSKYLEVVIRGTDPLPR